MKKAGIKKGTRPRTRKAVDPAAVPNVGSYDVCLSFAGEDRPYVDRVARALQAMGLRVFYDKYEQSVLWGKDLYTHLDEIYRLRARFCVVFVSAHYKKKLWTNHERRSAQARALLENDEYILPVIMDETQVPGLLPTIGFIDGRTTTPRAIAEMVRDKVIAHNQNSRIVRIANSEFRRVMFESFDFAGLSRAMIQSTLGGRWLLGKKGAWVGKVSDGRYILKNTTRLAATLNNLLAFTDAGGGVADLSQGKVSVRVRLCPPFSANSGAGLVFRLGASGDNYLAFYRNPGRSVSLCRVVNGQLGTVWADELPEIDDKEFVRLTAIGRSHRVDLMVDAAIVLSFDEKEIVGPRVGTSVIGTGSFEFDDFAMYVRA